MSLKSNIEGGIKDAMRAKDQDRLRALRAIKSLILLEETSGNSTGELTTDAEMKILTKAAKQRKDSMEVFVAQGRSDLAEKEQAELTVIEEFLPKQLTEEELKAARLRGDRTSMEQQRAILRLISLGIYDPELYSTSTRS